MGAPEAPCGGTVVVKMFGPLVEIARLQNEINRIFESLLNYSPEDSLKAASGSVEMRKKGRRQSQCSSPMRA